METFFEQNLKQTINSSLGNSLTVNSVTFTLEHPMPSRFSNPSTETFPLISDSKCIVASFPSFDHSYLSELKFIYSEISLPCAFCCCKIFFNASNKLTVNTTYSHNNSIFVPTSKRSNVLPVPAVYQNRNHPARLSQADYIPEIYNPPPEHLSNWNNSNRHLQKNTVSRLHL